MWQQNGCPECSSSTFAYRTIDGRHYKTCFRCGWMSRLNNEREMVTKSEVIPELKKY